MTNDMNNTFQDLASACQEIERLKADNRALESELARVFDALGISNQPNSKPLPTHEHVARLKSENARLAESLAEWEEKEGGCCPENVSFVDVISKLRAENARLAAGQDLMLVQLNHMAERFVKQEGREGPRDPTVYEQGIGMERAWQELRKSYGTGALRDLLAPTIELLQETAQLEQDSGWYLQPQKLQSEINRLRAACGEKEKK